MLVSALLGCLVGCSGPTYTAQLRDGAGLGEGSRVQVQGVEVGQVRSVKLVSGNAEVRFQVERGNELALRADACARGMVADGTSAAYLEVFPGEDPTMLGEQPIPRCPDPTEELGQLGQALGQGLQDLFAGFGQGMGQASQGLAQQMSQALQQAAQGMGQLPIPTASGNPPPFQPGTSGAPACAGMNVVIASRTPVDDPLLFPEGGTKITLEFRNDSDRSMRLPAIGNVLFLEGDSPLASSNIPGETWFMPIDVGARGTTQVVVAFERTPSVDGIEVRQVTPTDAPLDTCTLSASGL